MSALVCKLLWLLPGGVVPRLRTGRVPAGSVPEPDGRWRCLELAGQPVAEPALRTARELVVGRAAELTLEVLAAAPVLAAVVLPPPERLPRPVAAELARREIATIWRLPATESRPSRSARRAPATRPPAGAAGGCPARRRGPVP